MVAKYCTVQDVLLWTRKGNFSSGKPQYNPPVAIKVRWDDDKVEVIDPTGRKVTSNAVIMSPTEMPVGSVIYLGTLATWATETNYPNPPTPLQGGYEIIQNGHHPDFQGNELLHKAYI